MTGPDIEPGEIGTNTPERNDERVALRQMRAFPRFVRVSLLLTLSFISLQTTYRAVEFGVVHLRFAYLATTLILLGVQYTLIYRPAGHTVTPFVLLLVWLIFHLRVFSPALGRLKYVYEGEPTVEIVIMTYPESPRGNAVESWVAPLLERCPYVLGYTVEHNTSRVTDLVSEEELSGPIPNPKLRSNVLRVLEVMQRYGQPECADWLLYLEDDAVPLVSIEEFATILDTLRRVAEYDLITLDHRSVFMDYTDGSMIGLTGALFRRTSLSYVADSMVRGYRVVNTREIAYGADGILGFMIDHGAIKGTCVPVIREMTGLPSTLDWGRDAIREQRAIPFEKFGLALAALVVFIVMERYTEERVVHKFKDIFKGTSEID